MRADQLLERGDFAELRPDRAVDHQVGAMRKCIGSLDVLGRVAAKALKRVFAFDPFFIEESCSVPAEHDGAEALGAHGALEHEPDAPDGRAGSRQGRDSSVSIRSKANPAVLARKLDQPQASRGHHRQLGNLVVVGQRDLATSRALQGHGSVGASVTSGDAHHPCRRCVVAGHLGQSRTQVGERVVPAAFDRDRAVRLTHGADQVLESLAEAIAKSFALGLPVVRENDSENRTCAGYGRVIVAGACC